MFQASNIKLIALAAIYVLHVTFFDALMGSQVNDWGTSSFSASTHQSSPKNNPSEESSYRLLTKHEQSKQALVSLPDAVDFVSVTFSCFIGQHIILPQFGAFAHLSAGSFKLYRLYRVFLI